MYDICHPRFHDIGKLGCKDHAKVTLAFHVYIELCEAKKLWDVNYKYNESLDILYLEARSSKNSAPEIYLPWPRKNTISLNYIKNLQQALECDRLTFVFKDGDGSSVYYRASAGLVKPVSPDTSKKLKQADEKKSALEKEVRQNTLNLYELASCAKDNTTNNKADATQQETLQ